MSVQKSGFTLVETLVAIAILMIAVAGPLTIANRALTSALYSRDQFVASTLAREELEIITNIRDNVIKNGGTISSEFGSCIRATAGSTVTCDVDITQAVSAISGCTITVCNINSNNQLAVTPNGYTHDNTGTGTGTKFSRYFYLTQMMSGGSLDPNDFQVTVKVDWNEGTVPNEVALGSELVYAPK